MVWWTWRFETCSPRFESGRALSPRESGRRARRCPKFRLLRKLVGPRRGERVSGRAGVLDPTLNTPGRAPQNTYAAFSAADADRSASAAVSSREIGVDQLRVRSHRRAPAHTHGRIPPGARLHRLEVGRRGNRHRITTGLARIRGVHRSKYVETLRRGPRQRLNRIALRRHPNRPEQRSALHDKLLFFVDYSHGIVYVTGIPDSLGIYTPNRRRNQSVKARDSGFLGSSTRCFTASCSCGPGSSCHASQV